ncbi:MAG TPA: hypothetical protein P5038_09625 [Candidatus Paceibacterota bacterium]|nr:hypothetical protein [Candidatus Paceibacterota bacterium]
MRRSVEAAVAGSSIAPQGSAEKDTFGNVPFWSPTRRKLLLAVLGIKAATFLIALGAITFFPAFNQREYHNDIHWPREGPPTLATYFATWDGAHYLFLSEEGYQKGTASCAFYPLWPYLIRACSWLTIGNHFVAGLLLANLLSLAAILVFHYFVAQHHGLATANASVVLMLAYPGAIFFSFIYTESLFLLLVTLFFLCLFAERYGWVTVIGFLLPLTKAVGVFCIFPLLVHLWLQQARWKEYLAYYGPILGYATYFGILYSTTGNAVEGFEAQRFYPNQPSIAHIFDPLGFLAHLFMPLRLHGMLDSALDRGLFLLLVACLYPIWKLNKVYFVYACFIGLVPAASSWFLSYTRNVMMCFPLFLVLARFLERRDNGFLLWYVVALSGAFQIWFLLRHINFVWTA